MQRNSIEGQRIGRDIKTIRSLPDGIDALRRSRQKLAGEAVLAVGALGIVVAGAAYSLNHLNRHHPEPGNQVTSSQPVSNDMPQTIDVQKVSEKPTEYYKPFEYYSGTVTIPLAEDDSEFHLGANTSPGSVIVKNVYIERIGGVDIKGSSGVEVKNPQFVMNSSGEVFEIFPDAEVYDTNPNADGTFTSKRRTIYAKPNPKFVFKGGIITKIEEKQLETNLAGNGEKFNGIRAVLNSNPNK